MADQKIDPRLYIPLVEGYTYDDPTFVGGTQGEAGETIEIDVPGVDAALQPPSTVFVVEQIFRKGADGRVTVDLVLEVEDMPGAEEYEVRVAAV